MTTRRAMTWTGAQRVVRRLLGDAASVHQDVDGRKVVGLHIKDISPPAFIIMGRAPTWELAIAEAKSHITRRLAMLDDAKRGER